MNTLKDLTPTELMLFKFQWEVTIKELGEPEQGSQLLLFNNYMQRVLSEVPSVASSYTDMFVDKQELTDEDIEELNEL